MIPTGMPDPLDLFDGTNWDSVGGLALDAHSIYVLDRFNQVLMQIDKTTHTATAVANVGDAWGFTTDGNTAWWMQSICSQPNPEGCLAKNVEIHRATLGTMTSTVLNTSNGWYYSMHMRTEGNCLFWDDESTKSVMRLAK
jgi:hypothetical protein